MRNSRLLLFITLLFVVTNAVAQEQKAKENYPLIKTSEVKNFPVKTGVYDHAFKQTDNSDWNISISIPDVKPDEKVPLVIALHWYGQENTYQEYSNCLAFPALDSLNAIIVAPSSGGPIWIHPANEKRVINLIQKLIKHWPIRKDQVIITGYSIGAVGSWNYAKKYKNLFCAAIPVSGQYKPSKIQTPLYVIHGEKDELFSIETVNLSIDQSIKKGSQIDFEVIKDYSHYMACSYVKALRSATIKVQTEVLDKM